MKIDKKQLKHISYFKNDLNNKDICESCSYSMTDREPDCLNWVCSLFDKYLGKYNAYRCQECIDNFGDKYRFKRREDK